MNAYKTSLLLLVKCEFDVLHPYERLISKLDPECRRSVYLDEVAAGGNK